MRKPRDYDSELKALDDKARMLKERRIRQLGELVIATGADTLSPEELAGALVAAKSADTSTKEAWRTSGAAYFQRNTHTAPKRVDRESGSVASSDGGTVSA